jgi:dTDP-4-amino-4,6-dideoxygalactose transaminase
MSSSGFERKPAILGGQPLCSDSLAVVKPVLPAFEQIAGPLRDILNTGYLTNNGPYVQAFEQALGEYFQVPYTRAVANATLGLFVALTSLKLDGEVILPSFTYAATPHTVCRAGLEPVFVDILPDTFTLDPDAVEAAITPRTAAILPVHIYGHPCEVDALGEIAQRRGLALLYDAAHATGSRYSGRPVGGFGDAEVFSFHATKIFPVGEGGCITTRAGLLAETVALMRKFGDPGDENTIIPGINAKCRSLTPYGFGGHEGDRPAHRQPAALCSQPGRTPGAPAWDPFPGHPAPGYCELPKLCLTGRYG